MANSYNTKFYLQGYGDLNPVATLYAVHDLSTDNGIEANHFFYDEESAINYGKRKIGLFAVDKLDIFYYPTPKGEIYKVIRESTCYLAVYSHHSMLRESKTKYWQPTEKGFLLNKNGYWSDEYIDRRSEAFKPTLATRFSVFDAFLMLGVNILNDSESMVYVADGRVFYYNYSLRKELRGNFICKTCYRVYAYNEKFGHSNVLQFVGDYNVDDSFYCRLNGKGEVVILTDADTEKKNILEKFHLDDDVIKRAYMACFNGGPCIELHCGRARLRMLRKAPNIKGSLLPDNRPPLHNTVKRKNY